MARVLQTGFGKLTFSNVTFSKLPSNAHRGALAFPQLLIHRPYYRKIQEYFQMEVRVRIPLLTPLITLPVKTQSDSSI